MGLFDFLFGKTGGGSKADAHSFCGTVIEYFDDLLEKNISGYEVEMMFYARELNIHAEFNSYPVTFLLKKGHRPALAILLVPKDRCDTPAIQNTMAACDAVGIPCLRFFNEDPNPREEVLTAIREKL